MTSSPQPSAVEATLEQAIALHQQGRWAEAERLYEEVIGLWPGHFDATHLLGVLMLQTGRAARAAALIGQAVELNPSLAEAHSNYAAALSRLKRHQEALASCEKALTLNPNLPDAHYNRAVAFGDLGRLEEALAGYDRVIALDPHHAIAHNNRGIALVELGRPEEAAASYERAITLAADYAEAHYNRSVALGDLKRYADALASCDCAIALNPNYAAAHNSRGVILSKLNRLDEALAGYDRALALAPGYVEAHINRGVALNQLRHHEEAVAAADRAIAANPDSAAAHGHRGIFLAAMGRYQDAILSYDRALALNPEDARTLANRAVALFRLNRHAEAMAHFDKAIALKPDDAEAQCNQSFCRLQLGQFDKGWRQFEWRWRMESLAGARRTFAQPLWLGRESLAGKTILLHWEQGMGDTIQFCRYAPLVAALGAKVVLEVQPPLAALMTSLAGVTQVVASGDPLPLFDFHCPLHSLPLAFGTDWNSIPASPAYLKADPARVADWERRLGPKTLPRVGFAWGGRSANLDEPGRSVPLNKMLQLMSGLLQFFSLQHELRPGDAQLLAARPGIRQVGREVADFADTAAVMQLLDLVVTVDTSVPHLAGALGRPVWVLLQFNPDWRWFLDRADSPWYPSARLFRQHAPADWSRVLADVSRELEIRFPGKS